MLQLSDISALQSQVKRWKVSQQRLVFVPTMGNLHQGHLQLVRQARSSGDKVIVSIFVNPMQFAPGTDFDRYPRTLKDDTQQLDTLDVDVLFTPAVNDIYPQDLEKTTKVIVPGLSDILCGEFRPGHFVGVTTIVAKLFNLVQPDVAIFGEKDYQQLAIIKKMVADLGFPVEIQSVSTIREADGLAMSSRNQYLTPEERAKAPLLYQTLQALKKQIDSGASGFPEYESRAMLALQQGGFRPEYVSIRHAATLAPASDNNSPLVILAAAWLGTARLIDNIAV
jgi:pantoate--beta-alanine ligase